MPTLLFNQNVDQRILAGVFFACAGRNFCAAAFQDQKWQAPLVIKMYSCESCVIANLENYNRHVKSYQRKDNFRMLNKTMIIMSRLVSNDTTGKKWDSPGTVFVNWPRSMLPSYHQSIPNVKSLMLWVDGCKIHCDAMRFPMSIHRGRFPTWRRPKKPWSNCNNLLSLANSPWKMFNCWQPLVIIYDNMSLWNSAEERRRNTRQWQQPQLGQLASKQALFLLRNFYHPRNHANNDVLLPTRSVLLNACWQSEGVTVIGKARQRLDQLLLHDDSTSTMKQPATWFKTMMFSFSTPALIGLNSSRKGPWNLTFLARSCHLKATRHAWQGADHQCTELKRRSLEHSRFCSQMHLIRTQT